MFLFFISLSNAVDLSKYDTRNKILVVENKKLYKYEKVNGNWKLDYKTDVTVGRNDIAKSGEKREGDGKTPSGEYTFGFIFGNAKEKPDTRLPYKKVKSTSKWVDDVNSKYYNQWVEDNVKDKDWNSAENLIEEQIAYKYAIVINYNINPIEKGNGSAIFLHVKTGKNTAGCIGVDENIIIDLMKFIDKETLLVIKQ